jgi:hypothetical protein
MNTEEELKRLEGVLATRPLPLTERGWGGAGLIVTHEPAPDMTGEFYTPPRWVTTQHPLEASWFIERLWEAFRAEERLDSCSKFEFFGRLGEAIEMCVADRPNASAQLVCAAVMREAVAIFDEMATGAFAYLMFSPGGAIASDLMTEDERSGFTTPAETIAFFAARGVEVS